MARIGRSFPLYPKSIEATVVAPTFIAPPVAVYTAAGLGTNWRRNQLRFPSQGWDGAETFEVIASSASNSDFIAGSGGTIGIAAATTRRIVSIRPDVSCDVSFVKLGLSKGGTPTDNLVVSIQADAAGVPNGVILGSVLVPGASLTTSIVSKTLALTAPLLAGGRYWLVLTRDGANDAANFYIARLVGAGTQVLGFEPATGGTFAYQLSTDYVYGSYARLLGPRPPSSFAPSYPTAPPTIVYLAAGLSTNQRHNTDRLVMYALFGVVPQVSANPPPPILVALAARSRRETESRRFPLQGWMQQAAFETPFGTTTQTVTTTLRTNGNEQLGDVASEAQVGQMISHVRGVISSADLNLLAVGAPADGVFIEIRNDAGGLPSGVAVATSNTVAAGSLGASRTTFTFASPPEVNGPAWVVLRRTGGLDAGNYYLWRGTSTLQAEGGTALFNSTSGVWSFVAATLLVIVTFTTFQSQQVLQQRFLGPRPPLVIDPLPSPLIDTTLTAVPQMRRHPDRRTLAFFITPQLLAQPPPLAPPLAVYCLLPDRLARRQRRQIPTSVLGQPILASGFIAPPLSVNCLHIDRLGRAKQRRLVSASLTPPTVLAVFGGPRVSLVTIRPRATTKRLAAPTVVTTAAVFVASPIAVTLAAVRGRTGAVRRIPRSRLAGPVFLPATSAITVTLARVRPRPTRRYLIAPTVLATFAGPRVTLGRIRPRKTRAALFAPTVVRVPSVEQRQQTIAVALVRTRPRPTGKRLAPPTTLQTFGPPVEVEVAVRVPLEDRRRTPRSRLPLVLVASTATFEAAATPLVRTRPRKTTSFLAAPATLTPYSVELAEATIRVALVRARPRKTVGSLTAVSYPATSEISATLTRIRPRPTRRYLAAPTVLQTFAGPLVALTRIRPRKTVAIAVFPATLEPEAVALAERTIRVTLTRTAPRPTTKRIAPPTVIRVPSVEQREQTITVTLVRSRPRPTARFLDAPTILLVPSVEARRRTITVVLTRARPRPTTKRLAPPTVIVTNPPVVTEILVSLTEPKNRRNWNRRLSWQGQRQRLVRETGTTTTYQQRDPFIGPRPPIIIDPLPTQRQTTITVWSVAIGARRGWTRSLMDQGQRQRPTRITNQGVSATYPMRDPFVGPRPPQIILPLPNPIVAVYPATGLLTNQRRAQQRRTDYFLAPPTVVVRQPVETVIAVTLATTLPAAVRAHRQARVIRIAPIRYAATSAISVTVVRARPRPTTRFVAAPTVVRIPQSGEIQVTLTRTRPRPTRRSLAAPTVVRVPEIEQRERTIRVVLTRSRPRPTRALVRAPAVVRVPQAGTIAVSLVRTRPRPTVKRIAPPTALKPFEGPKVTLTRIRPRPTTRFVAAPTVVIEASPPQRIAIVVQITRASLVQRRPLSKLSPPAVVAPTPLPTADQRTIRVTLVRIRPRPTRRILARPATLQAPPPPKPLWTDGEVIVEAETDGTVVEVGASGGVIEIEASSSGQVLLVADSAGEAVPTASADGTDERTGLTNENCDG